MLRCEDCKREYERGQDWIGLVQEYDPEVSATPAAPVVLFYCADCAKKRFEEKPQKTNGGPP